MKNREEGLPIDWGLCFGENEFVGSNSPAVDYNYGFN
jgi:hypothetical protein